MEITRAKFIAIVLCALIAGACILLLAQRFQQITVVNVGVVKVIGLEAYRDENLTQTLDFIDWGNIMAGENKSITVYIKNVGNEPQKFLMWTENWVPTNASDCVFLTWDYDNSWVPAGTAIPVVFTLSVVPEPYLTITTFTFDIWIKAI